MAPSKMKAIKVVEKGKAEIQEVPLPKLRDDYVLVKVNCKSNQACSAQGITR